MPVSRKRKKNPPKKPKLDAATLQMYRDSQFKKKLDLGAMALTLHQKGYSNKTIADFLRIPLEELDHVFPRKE